MIEIEEPPERPICSGCMSPLIWIYPARTRRWVAMVAESNMRLERHRCDQRDPYLSRQPSAADVVEATRRGHDLTQRVLAGEDPFTEEERHD